MTLDTLGPAKIFVIDDDEEIRDAFLIAFASTQVEVATASSAEDGLARLDAVEPEAIFLDLRLPGMQGTEALERIVARHPDVPVVIITGHGGLSATIETMHKGAFEFLSKPLELHGVRHVAARAIEAHRMWRVAEPPPPSTPSLDGPSLVGRSPSMIEVFKSIAAVTSSDAQTTVLLTGETGTGKELTARIVHGSGQRALRPFIVVNCTILTESLLASELFGHERGSFTGANERHIGRVEQAKDGTVFLDEVGRLTPPLQQRFLRLLQEREFQRVGGNEVLRTQARFVAATNQDLLQLVTEGSFLRDLYYRLDVFKIVLPPLRERRADIAVLIGHFVSKLRQQHGIAGGAISDAAMAALIEYDYPGNVRQLENIIERALVLARGRPILLEHLPPEIVGAEGGSPAEGPGIPQFAEARVAALDAFEMRYARRLLREVSGSVSEAARRAGLQRQSLQRIMRRHGIRSEDFRK